MGIRFEGDQVLPLSNGRLYTTEGCASMSDVNGNLLFYTDGSTVYNSRHQIMLNGEGLKGNSSSTQSAIVIPFPNQPGKYVIFTVGADDAATIYFTLNEGFNYYFVDMSLDNGLGGVIFPENNNLLPLCSEKIAAVKHINRRDFWVVTHYGDKFYSYLVSPAGVSSTPVVSSVGPNIDVRTYPVNSRGYLKLSPNGKKLAIAHLSNLDYDTIPIGRLPTLSDEVYPANGPFANGYPGYLGLYDFNKGTGVITNEIVLDTSGSPYGVEFSSNSGVLYANLDYHSIDEGFNVDWLRGELVQYNLGVSANQISGTKRVLKTYTIQDTQSALFTARGALQLALNHKIYYTRDYKSYLSHIEQPNDLLNPMFEEFGYRFPYYTYNVNTRYGLPPFISSSFIKDIEVINAPTNVLCYGEAAQLRFVNEENLTILSYLWDFGDGNTSANELPIHLYTTSGVFTVRLTINSAEYGVLTYETQLTVSADIVLNEAILTECDTDSDGKVLFHLNNANAQLSTQTDLQFSYFKTLTDAQLNQNAINVAYVSTLDGELIYVRGFNEKGCYAISKIRLTHSLPSVYALAPFNICVDGEEVLIPLANYKEKIEELLVDESIMQIRFYANKTDAFNQANAISSIQLGSMVKKVYATVQYFDKICNDLVELTFVPSVIPLYELEDVIKCKDEPATFTAPVGYSYRWIGLSGEDANQNLTQASIQIKNEGNYRLEIKNEIGCIRMIDFSVANYSEVIVTDVFVDSSNAIIVQAVGEGLSYSIDLINWINENVIVGLVPGNYTIYIRNKYGCITAVNDIVIFKWTNFFSPNQDVTNDKWEINGLDKYKGVEVQIFDRFGKLLVDKVMDYDKVIWDGTYNGKKQASGSYWYIIKIPGHVKHSGFVLLKSKI